MRAPGRATGPDGPVPLSPEEALEAEALGLFAELLELDAGDRLRRMDEACRDRPALRARVQTLLDRDTHPHPVLDGGAATLWTALVDGGEMAGRAVGPWRIVRELGRGGMGAVYLAERADGEFEKEVALKLVKRGMDTDEILSRFRQERRILASLEHPNIARLYDGGVSAEGLPYLVMEKVEGEPITAYSQRLDLDRRLSLFVTICRAVQHAHQKLVVHRDLKPSNILVTPEGVPMLLDFGIAKVLGGEGEERATRTGVRAWTPEYAAPEQASGDPVTTATDVFALGVLLYELLTGARPFSRDWAAGEPAGAWPDPERPSAVTGDRRLAGDLDTIVRKALEPDPGRRYATAQELLEDVERHRSARPIQARPPSPAYLLGKYLRRRAKVVAAAGLVFLSLGAGLGATLWQARETARERDAAQQARADAEQVAAFLLDLFARTDPLGVGLDRSDTLTVRGLLARGTDRVRTELADQPRLQAELLTVLGRVHLGLGDYPEAEALVRDALALHDARARSAVGEGSGDPGAGTGRDGGGPDPSRAVPLAVLAGIAQARGEFPAADSLFREVLSVYEAEAAPTDSLYLSLLTDHGLVLTQLGAFDEAREVQERALARLLEEGWDGGFLHGRVLTNLASLLYEVGDYAAAETAFRAVVEVEDRYLPPGHARRASTLNNLGSTIHYQGRLEEAEPLQREAVRIGRAALGPTHPEVGNFLQNLATLLDDLGRYDEAAELYRESLAAHEVSLGRDNVFTALVMRNLALNRLEVGEVAEARDLLEEALGVMYAGLGPDHLYTGVTEAALGRTLLEAGDTGAARDHLVTSLEILEAQLPRDHFLVQTSLRDLGAWHTSQGAYAEAEALLLESLAGLETSRGADHYATREARRRLRELYTAWGRPDAAEGYGSSR